MKNIHLRILRISTLLIAILVVSLFAKAFNEYQAKPKPTPRVAYGPIVFKACGELESQIENTEARGYLYCTSLYTGLVETEVVILTDLSAQQIQADGWQERLPVFWHPGGPGISPTSMLKASGAQLNLEKFVAIAWDGQTANKNSGVCGPESIDFFQTVSPEFNSYWPAAKTVLTECQELLRSPKQNIYLGYEISAAAEASELELIRRALGIEKVNLFVSSFAGVIAETYAALFPQHLGQVAVASPLLSETGFSERTASADDALLALETEWAKECAQVCPADLAAKAAQGWPTLRSYLLSKEAQVGSGNSFLSPLEFDQAVFALSKKSNAFPEFQTLIEPVVFGDATAIAQTTASYVYSLSRATYYEIACDYFAGTIPEYESAFAQAKSTSLGAFIHEHAPCAVSGSKKPKSLPETSPDLWLKFMVIQGGDDPFRVQDTFAKSWMNDAGYVCIFKDYSHDVNSHPKFSLLVERHLLGLKTGSDSNCLVSDRL